VSKRVLDICGKTSDMFTATLVVDGIECSKFYEGYVPCFFPGDHYGDYIQFKIDVDTGVIENWRKPTEKELSAMFSKHK